MAIKLWPLVTTQIKAGARAQVAAYGPMLGGYIINPPTAADQGIAAAEPLFVDLVNTAGIQQSGTTTPVYPGQIFNLPENSDSFIVSVNAATLGHRYGGVIFQPEPGFKPPTGPFPPLGPTMATAIIPSYLYQEYNDDENVQAFVTAYNQMAQGIYDWFVGVGLPIYPGLTGTLLDWVGGGVYGINRPVLPSGTTQTHGPLNTVELNTHALNVEEIHGPPVYYLTSDDAYKRIITWHFYKGDGKWMNVRRLKRMVMRFLTLADGWGDPIDNTYPVSVTFGVNGQVNINLQSIRRYPIGGALFNLEALNAFVLDDLETRSISITVSPLVPIFKAAMDSGVLEFPFQFTPIVNI